MKNDPALDLPFDHPMVMLALVQMQARVLLGIISEYEESCQKYRPLYRQSQLSQALAELHPLLRKFVDD